MNLAIVICTNNRYDLLGKAVESALIQGESACEIVVVDNSPNRGDSEAFARRYAHVPKIHFAFENVQNLSHARNVGVSVARTDVVAFMDDDAVAEPYWAKALLDAFVVGGANVGCVGGPVRPIWASEQPTWLTPNLAGYLSILDFGDKKKELSPGEWLAGCNISFRRQSLIDIGGFRTDVGRIGNELCLLSNEEAAAWQQLKRMGKRVLYEPNAIVFHHINENRANAQWLSRRIAWQAVSDIISDPEYALSVATSVGASFTMQTFWDIAKNLRRSKPKSPLSNNEAQALYKLVVTLLSTGIGRRAS